MTTELKPPPITRDQIGALITATVDRAEGYTTEEHEAAEVVLRELLAIALEARDLQWQARVAELERDAAQILEVLKNCAVHIAATRGDSDPYAQAAFAFIRAREGKGAEG